MLSPTVHAEEIANEHGAILEHASGALWVTSESVPSEAADALIERFQRAGYGARVVAPDDLKPGNVDLIVDLTSALAEYRQSAGRGEL